MIFEIFPVFINLRGAFFMCLATLCMHTLYVTPLETLSKAHDMDS